ncbi:MAG: EpsG family protein [Lachnospiraceae bacterium]|nr:EpsG family protein [Lachnospiraceae bacterium]
MPVYLILTILTIGLAKLTVDEEQPHSRALALNRTVCVAIFVMLFAVSALRYRVGNDYWWYTEIMHEIGVMHHEGAYGIVPTEPLFNALVWLIYNATGADNYLLVFALMSFFTAAGFVYVIRRQSDSFFLSFTMFLLLCFYFQSFSTVRYYAAMPLALMALPCIEKRDWPRLLLFGLIGGLMHKTLFVILILYPLAGIRRNRILAGAGICAGALCALFPEQVMELGYLIYPTWRNAWGLSASFSVLNVARCALVLLFVFLNRRREEALRTDERVRILTNMTFMALLMHLCLWYVPQLSRITYYLILPQIFLVPRVLLGIRDEKSRKWQTALVLAACLLYFIRYMMHAGDDGILVLPYRTFLFTATE